ncbi:uncharacterized protein LOC126735668 [Anthonomus grandis grandis]|uniref:uncharacterized protein LOC126735668 n=1 Tax=Anthonomus grandis grandis TaxID=2921223 RepID=UPI0021662D5F|nr:uncharacterized protein LOC126735668 [Anthonomus grandis grandis]
MPYRVTSFFLSSTSSDINVDICIPKFWEIRLNEQILFKTFPSPDDIKCELFFKKTTTRDPTGRFVVSLPFRNSKPDLGDTYPQAYRLFLLLEKRLIKFPTLYAAYSNFMREYCDMGHMSVAPSSSRFSPKPTCFLPYHCVLKPESVSTKLRVVWDGSAKGPTGISLNDTLLPGPKLQKDITSLLLTFRLDPIVFIADIKQMFRQILVSPSDRDFQKILWRLSPDEPLLEYTLNTVTFRLSCSPYLAMRTIQELALIEQANFPKASQVLLNQIYIDDVLGSSSSIQAAL